MSAHADAALLPPFDPDSDAANYTSPHGQRRLNALGHAAAFPFGHGLSYTQGP